MAQELHKAFTNRPGKRVNELKTIGNVINSSTDPVLQVQSEKFIWDTGATNTTINVSMVAPLKLKHIGIAEVHGAHGSQECYTYVVDIAIHSGIIIKNIPVIASDLGPNTDVLIGMDIIGMGEFVVSLEDGKTVFSFCYPPFNNHHDLVEKSNKVNERIIKQNRKNKS
jgi:hypothetical protein